jgi:ABC-type multidrug transport system fused ATPase/permease subunit
MFNWSDTGNIVWSFFWILAFFAYLMALFAVVGDLFRDHTLTGWGRALWILFLVFVPFLTVLVYLIARGSGMQVRAERAANQMQHATDSYIRSVVHISPAEEITKAKALLDDGVITHSEYETLKAQALAQALTQTSTRTSALA